MRYRYPHFFCLQDILKMFSRHVFRMSSRHVFKTSSRHVFKMSSRHVFKTSSRRLQRNNFSSSKTSSRRLARFFQDVFNTSSRCLGRQKIVMLKTCWRHLQDVLKTSWRPTKMLAGSLVLYYLLQCYLPICECLISAILTDKYKRQKEKKV